MTHAYNDIEEIKINKFSSKLIDESKLKLYVGKLINDVGLITIQPQPTIKQIESTKNLWYSSFKISY